jgi:cyclophilin family peptidyl-prolyl cis-trans isomerase
MPPIFPTSRLTGRLIFLVASLCTATAAYASDVTIHTPLGDIEVHLFDEQTPATVANFLKYVNDGSYNSSFIHRSVPGFVIQGGGFAFKDDKAVAIAEEPPVINEPGISNLRGTIAMAKLPDQPNSATNQWFFNLKDNSAELDSQNGGFTVFGEVSSGMNVVDAIAALKVWNAGAPFGELPLINFTNTGPIRAENLVLLEVTQVNRFEINSGLNDAWSNAATRGQGFFVNVFPDIGKIFFAWFTYDTARPEEPAVAIVGEPGHRWLTAFGDYSGNSAELDVEITRGGVFDSALPAPSQGADGTIFLEFSDCENGTVSYAIPSINRQGVIPIKRIALDNVALCEQMANGTFTPARRK